MNRALSYLVSLSATVLWLSSTPLLAVNSTWVGGSTGSWTDAGNWSAGIPQVAGDTATINTPVTVTVPASITIKTLTVNAAATVTVASGATLAFSNGGGDVLIASANLTIDGDGALTFSRNGTSTTDFANIKPASGVTITLDARVTGLADVGIELNASGTLLLTNPNNSFTGMTLITAGNGTIAFTDPGALGLSAIRYHGSPSRFVYTGSGPAALTLPVQVYAASGTFENAGAGTLTLSGDISPVSAGTKTLTFAGTTQANLITGTISNGVGVLSVVSGSGTLMLNGTVTDSSVTVNGGSLLVVEDSSTFTSSTLSFNGVSTLSLNASVSDGFAVTLPLTNALSEAGVRWLIPPAATTSTVTVPELIRAANATLDLVAPGIGTASNTLFVQNFAAGPLPAWFTVNGLPAAYDDTLGVIPAAVGATYSLTALGPSTVPNDATGAAVIDSPGTSGGINLTNNPTTVFSLTQDHADNPATVDLGGQTLVASVVAVTAAGNNLILTNGTLTALSTLTAPSGPFSLPSLPTAPIAWFDLSDAATVTTNSSGRITSLANKGSLTTALDAVVPAGSVGPRYVPNAVAGLGVARSDEIDPPQGLVTSGNAGITGSAARTAFLVVRRSPVSQNSFYALYLGADAANNQSFAIVERSGSSSFVTMGNDLDVAPASPSGLNVLTFTTGLGGTPNAGQAFRNGLSLGTKTFALATVDNPIRLLHRPEPTKAPSGPGDVAEALVFNYTLSDSDRAAVEAYLMQKWQIVAQQEETLLALRNEHVAAELSIPALVADPYAAKAALAKSGSGDVTLGGPLAYSGTTLIYDGALTFDTPAGLTNALFGPVVGEGSLVKRGLGGLAIAPYSLYTGGTTVQAGTLLPGANGALGTGPVVVENGAALDVVYAAINGGAAFGNSVSVEGSGPDGLGALRNSHYGNNQQNAFKYVTLTDDTAVQVRSRLDVRSGSFDFGGNSLTVNGGNIFSIVASAVSGVTSGTGIQVANGQMNFDSSDFQGSAANVASAASGSGVNLLSITAPMQWSLTLADNAYFSVGNGGTGTNLNQWAGPVTLDAGTARLNAANGGSAVITGAIAGNGGLLKEGPGWFWLLNSANTYAGATAVTQGILYAVSPDSLGTQGSSALTVSDTGSFHLRTAAGSSPDGWSAAQIAEIADASTFTTPGTTTLGIDTIYEDFSYTGSLPYAGLSKYGPRKLTLTGGAPDWGPLTVFDGELDLTGTGSHDLHTNSLIVGALSTASTVSVLRVAGATLTTDDPGYNRAGPTLTVGSVTGSRSVLHVGADAIANGRLTIGDAANSAGAVYQTSGIVTNTGGAANDAALGSYGYGYYRLDDGTLANKGYTQLGRNSGSTGIFEQRGGSFIINPGAVPADGVVGDYYNGTITTRKGVGVYLLSGGTFNLNAHSLQLGEWSNAGDYNDGYATLTLENDAQADVDYMILANRNGNPQAYVNLNGGSLTARYFQKGGNNTAGNTSQAAISFNGGVLRVPSTGNTYSSLVRTGANNSPALLNVYAGGAVIDTLDAASITLEQPLLAPANFGVANVAATGLGAGYLAPPAVLFTGGNGTGATAVAEINLGTGALTGIRVTSPGVGYTSVPTVTLRGGGYTTLATATATLGASASGGLTKLGSGVLNLAATNTFTGPTVVSNGVLRLGAGSQTLSSASTITVAGGTLDLGGATHTNLNPVTIESGRLVNGAVSALSFTKVGTGTATLTAMASAPTAAAVREAFIQSLGPIIWYDPSDDTPGNITVDGSSRVSLLRNKGTLGATHDAVPVSGTGPLFLSGGSSPSPLGAGVLQIDGGTAVMKSISDVPITGTAPRTLIALIARDTNRGVVGIGSGAEGQTFEIGNDPTKTYVSGIGAARDTQFTSNIPAVDQLTFIAAVNGYGGNLARGIQLWRSTGAALETMTATWPADLGTASSPFSIGRRGATAYRGKVGEVLLFNRILSINEMAALKEALVAKYLIAPESGDEVVPPIAVNEGTLRLAPGADAIARLAPTIWYDPSDAASVTTNGSGRVSGILNKGTKPGMDAITGISNGGTPLLAPLLATGSLSYAASRLPMIGIDANNCGLASGATTGITGTAPRTVVGIFARDNSTTAGPITAFGNNSSAQLYEVGDRHNGTVIGCFGTGNDLIVTPLNPVQQANVLFGANTGANVNEFWRTGLAPQHTSFTTASTIATVDSRFFIGQRPNTANRADFRGQIGEIILFDRFLTEAERVDLEDYLVNKWMTSNGTNSLFAGTVFDVAEGATLDLSGARENITITGTGTLTNGTLSAGAVISPAGDAAVGTLALNGVTLASGAVYRLTASGGSASDRLLVNGDLSALTIVPATDDEVPSGTYVIATGDTTNKPVLSGFPDKFKIIRQGNDLLLTTVGGSIIRFL